MGTRGIPLLLAAVVCLAQEPPLRAGKPPVYPGDEVPRGFSSAAAAELFAAAVTAQKSKDFSTAVTKYEEFLRLRPGFVPALSNLGAALAALGRFDEAVASYEQALRREPANRAIRANLALAYYKRAEFRKAADEFEAVHAADQGNEQALYLLADCYLRLGENGKVIDLLAPLVDRDPDDRAGSYLLGTALLRDGQHERGRKLIERFMRFGDTAEIHLLIGASQLAAGDYEVALTTLKKAADLNPNLPGVWALYGRAEMENDHSEEAKAAFRRELAADPTDFDANLNLGALLRMETRFEEARPLIERALAIRPASIAARYQAASLELAGGRLEEARKILEAMVAEAPDFVEAHAQLAATYYKLGRRDDGRRHREIIMKLQAESRKQDGARPQKAAAAP